MTGTSLYTAMAGLQAISARMEAAAANLANQQTPGYAAVQSMTEAADYQGGNAPPGADAVVLTPGPDLQQGEINHTGDPMNVALGGDAWLEVQTPTGNALTRDGSLSLSSAGILTDSAGNPVLNTGGQPISLPSLASSKSAATAPFPACPPARRAGRRRPMGRSTW